MTTLQIRITVSAIPPGFGFSARGFIDSMHRFLKKTCGGSCVGIVTDGSAESRGAQWERICSAGADQRNCYVFPTEGHYRRWSEQQKAYFQSQSR